MGLLKVSVLAGNLESLGLGPLILCERERIIGGCWVRALVTLEDTDMGRM